MSGYLMGVLIVLPLYIFGIQVVFLYFNHGKTWQELADALSDTDGEQILSVVGLGALVTFFWPFALILLVAFVSTVILVAIFYLPARGISHLLDKILNKETT